MPDMHGGFRFAGGPESQRCQYPSKQCQQPRALKLNGKLHKLCEMHRQQANRNQQRLQQRRKLREFEELQQYLAENFGVSEFSDAVKRRNGDQSPLRSDDEEERELAPEELVILQSLLTE